MNNLETLEYGLVAVVIALQCISFFITIVRVRKYRKLLPEEFMLVPGQVTVAYEGMDEELNEGRKELIGSVNEYLSRNSTGSPDFNLVKDIVERNTGVLEEQISHTVSVPLYLGLMGTMCGIVAGLWNMSSLSETMNEPGTSDALGAGIGGLLGGVKIAMIASFTGIAFTVINSSYIFSRARQRVERNKNILYNFIQSTLMPLVSKNVNEVMQRLLNNMVEFTKRFDMGLSRLEVMMNKNFDSLKAQDNILTTLLEIDINQFVGGNIKVLSELRKSTDKLDRFNDYLDKMAVLLGTSEKLSEAFTGILTRTGNFEEIARNVDLQFSLHTELMQFLKSHFADIKARGGLIQNAVIDVDRVLDDSLTQLKAHVEQKLQAIKDITVTEQNLLSKAMEENRVGLGKLGLLEDLRNEAKVIRENMPGQVKRIEVSIENLEAKMSAVVEVLKEIKVGKVGNWKRFLNWLKKK
ncbi:MAG: hypothetical protein NTW29_17005 [Bacteroidetes bacterium]|nr:hypothetical protein [Bacteroidota bacterium]